VRGSHHRVTRAACYAFRYPNAQFFLDKTKVQLSKTHITGMIYRLFRNGQEENDIKWRVTGRSVVQPYCNCKSVTTSIVFTYRH
jgi:hypothetical protein